MQDRKFLKIHKDNDTISHSPAPVTTTDNALAHLVERESTLTETTALRTVAPHSPPGPSLPLRGRATQGPGGREPGAAWAEASAVSTFPSILRQGPCTLGDTPPRSPRPAPGTAGPAPVPGQTGLRQKGSLTLRMSLCWAQAATQNLSSCSPFHQ